MWCLFKYSDSVSHILLWTRKENKPGKMHDHNFLIQRCHCATEMCDYKIPSLWIKTQHEKKNNKGRCDFRCSLKFLLQPSPRPQMSSTVKWYIDFLNTWTSDSATQKRKNSVSQNHRCRPIKVLWEHTFLFHVVKLKRTPRHSDLQSDGNCQGFLETRGALLKMGENNVCLVQKETCRVDQVLYCSCLMRGLNVLYVLYNFGYIVIHV